MEIANMETFEEFKRAVESAEIVDAHAHNIVALDSTAPFLSCFSAPTGDTSSDSSHTLDFKRSLNDICELYGSSYSLDAVQESRRCIGLEASAAICFKAARIATLLIDDGIELDKKLDIKWHESLVPTVGRIVQVEQVAESILDEGSTQTSWTLDSFMETFTAELKSEADRVVAFKSIIAHRSGLGINVEVTQKEAAEGLNDVLCGKLVGISNKSFIDYIFLHALEVAQIYDLPMQIDTGYGDNDLDLRPANPLNLCNLLEDKRYNKNRLVLLHASFPFLKEASYLASVYPRVYLDFGLMIPKLSFHGIVSSVKEILALAPIHKVMINTGGIAFAESFYLGAKKAREVVFNTLWDAFVEGDISITESLAAVKDIFAENAKQFYKLDISSRYSDVEPLPLSTTFQKEKLNVPMTDVTLVRVMWLDFSGLHRCRVIRQHQFYSSVRKQGLGLTIQCMRVGSATDIPSTYTMLPPSGEVRIVPDLSTKHRLPWARNQEMVFVDMLTEPGKAWKFCPRDVLYRFAKVLEDGFGLAMDVGIEVEFYLLKRAMKDGKEIWAAIDRTSYCATAAIDIASSVLEEIVASLQSFNIIVEQLHPEAGRGQFEIVLGYTDCRRAANNLVITHEVIKGIARKHELLASFMPRYYYERVHPWFDDWSRDDLGSGSHLHISLSKNGENVFMASGEPTRYGLSKTGEFFLAGVLEHLGSTTVYTMPLENSYDRRTYKTNNSRYLCWGIESKELIARGCCPPGAADSVLTNFELKTFDGAAHPLLGLACIVITGIDGLRRSLPTEPIEPEADVYDFNNYGNEDDNRLPRDLRDSNVNMHANKYYIDMLGEDFMVTRGGVLGKEITHATRAEAEKYVHMVYNY